LKPALRLLLLLVAWLFTCRPAAADQRAAHEDSSPERLYIVLVGSVQQPELERLLDEWLETSGLAVTIVGSRSLDVNTVFAVDRDPVRIRIWLTMPSPNVVRLTFADPQAERFLVRDVPLERSLDELGREQIAQVLLAAAQAFRERREDTPREEVRRALEQAPQSTSNSDDARTREQRTAAARTAAAPASADADAGRDAAGPVVGWAPGVRYALRFKGPEGVSHGPGFVLESTFAWPTARLGGSIEARYEFAHDVETDEVELSIATLALRVGLVGALGGERSGLLGEAGFGLDRDAVKARARAGSNVEPRSNIDDQHAVFHALVGPYVRWGSFRASFGLRLDVALVRTHYDVIVDGEAKRVLTPWQVQPGTFVGAAWD
jgi:hypothetical protein